MKTISWNSFVCALFWGNQVFFWGWKWNFGVLIPRKTEKSQQLHLCFSSTHLHVVTGKGPARRRGFPAAPALSTSTLDAQRSPLQQSVRKKPKKACRTMRRFRGKKGLKKILEIIKAFTLLPGEISHIHVFGKHLHRLFLTICQIVSSGYSTTSLGNTFQYFTSLIFRKVFYAQHKFSFPLFLWRKITYVCHNLSVTKSLLTLPCCHGGTQK